MSTPDPQFAMPDFAAAPPKQRPGIVSAAAGIQLLMLALGVVGAILAVMYGPDITEAMRAELESQGAAPDLIDQAADGGDSPIALIVSLALAAVYGGLGLLNLGGRNWARITTWVMSGLMLACSLLGVAVASMLGGVQTGDIDIAKMMEAGYDAVPAWYNGYVTGASIVGIAGYLAVTILLALPAANQYFRKTPAPVVLPPEAR